MLHTDTTAASISVFHDNRDDSTLRSAHPAMRHTSWAWGLKLERLSNIKRFAPIPRWLPVPECFTCINLLACCHFAIALSLLCCPLCWDLSLDRPSYGMWYALRARFVQVLVSNCDSPHWGSALRSRRLMTYGGGNNCRSSRGAQVDSISDAVCWRMHIR